MHEHLVRMAAHLIGSMAAALTLTVFLSCQLQAQRRIPMTEQERTERDLTEREYRLHTIGKVKRKDLEVGAIPAEWKEIKKNFEEMQVANNNILRALASKLPLDHRQISADVSAIRRRASSLKVQLSLPADSEKNRKHDEPLDQPLRAALLKLDALIVSFVSNPIFKNTTAVVDVSYSVQARRDLENIIDLSERIRKNAAQLDRTQKAALASP
jgi:hypothetical protein